MKRIIFLLIAALFALNADAQVIKRLADRTKNKLENKASEKINQGIDKATEPKKKSTDKKDKTKKENTENEDEADEESTSKKEVDEEDENNEKKETKSTPSLSAYSKYDFIPGDKIVVYGNFEKDAIGDFPVNWNTNASGEVVTLNNKEGKWFQINKEGVYHPEFITEIPDNFTLEFDLGVNNDFDYYSSVMSMAIGHIDEENTFVEVGHGIFGQQYEGIKMTFHPVNASKKVGRATFFNSLRGNHRIDNDVDIQNWFPKTNNFLHISLWRQNQRLRVYANQEKIFDLPKAFDTKSKYNSIVFATNGMHNKEDYYVINNIRLAVGSPDTRNKLITEGKFVTRGILFDVNSDKIRPESYGVLKDIANVLNENPSVKISIIGHTDSDGEDADNLDLSKRRASSVKAALEKEFNVSADRMQTDGKGESQPADKNNTPEAKANNRRVEFIKN